MRGSKRRLKKLKKAASESPSTCIWPEIANCENTGERRPYSFCLVRLVEDHSPRKQPPQIRSIAVITMYLVQMLLHQGQLFPGRDFDRLKEGLATRFDGVTAYLQAPARVFGRTSEKQTGMISSAPGPFSARPVLAKFGDK